MLRLRRLPTSCSCLQRATRPTRTRRQRPGLPGDGIAPPSALSLPRLQLSSARRLPTTTARRQQRGRKG
eukprot:14543789-Alexandrium_andersonii.AAC.1